VEHLSGAPLGQALALIESMTLGWEDLPGTNTLAYYEGSSIMDVASFIALAPGWLRSLFRTHFVLMSA
jgi:hypothetical protein